MQPSWSKGGTTRHNFKRGPSNDYFIKVWFQLSNWFQRKRFLCEFPIGFYVKLSSAVWGHLGQRAEPPDIFLEKNHPMTISSKFSSYRANGFFMGISHRVLWEIKFGCGGHLGRRSEMQDTILEGDHPRIISANFGSDWLSSFRGEDFF